VLLAVFCALFGLVMGEIMGISGDHSQTLVHSRTNV
jgi:hypothetical protein